MGTVSQKGEERKEVVKARALLVVLALLLSGCAGTKFYFFGMDVEKLKEMNKVEAAAGAVVAIGTHIGGHFLAGAIEGNDVEFDSYFPPTERYERDTWLANNGGFLLQHSVGLALTSFERTRHWDFTRGYVAMSAVQTWSYPLRNKDSSDFQHGNKYHWEEYGVYSTVALHNLLRTNWTTEE